MELTAVFFTVGVALLLLWQARREATGYVSDTAFKGLVVWAVLMGIFVSAVLIAEVVR